MNVKLYEFSPEQLQALVSQTFDAAVKGLASVGEITTEQAARIGDNYVLIASEKGILGRAFDRLFGDDSKGLRLHIAAITLPNKGPHA